MWHYVDGEVSPLYRPRPIPIALVDRQAFVMLGRLVPLVELDIDKVLEALDTLIPLYEFTESALAPEAPADPTSGTYRTGIPNLPASTSGTARGGDFNISLKHNEIQRELVRQLADEFGLNRVRHEQFIGACKVDVVLVLDAEIWIYEIKTGASARACIRDAVGQLLDYAYGPHGLNPQRLFVVGTPALDDHAAEYLRVLRKRFNLPIEYRKVDSVATQPPF